MQNALECPAKAWRRARGATQPGMLNGRESEIGARDAYGRDQDLGAAPWARVRRGRMRARDPCLRSPDPRCYERNRDATYRISATRRTALARRDRPKCRPALARRACEYGGTLGGSFVSTPSIAARGARPYGNPPQPQGRAGLK